MQMRRPRMRISSNEEREIPDVDVRWTQLLGYLKPYLLRLFIAILALIGSAALSLVFPALIGGVGDIQGVVGTVLSEGNVELLDDITLVLLGVFLLRSFTTLIEVYNINFIGERLIVDIRKRLYAHLQSMSVKFYTERRVGELVSRLSSDVTSMRTVLTNNLTTLLQQGLIMIGSVMIMFFINWRLSLFIVVLIPIIVVVMFIFGFYMRRVSTQVQDEIAGATVVAEEVMQNIREVKALCVKILRSNAMIVRLTEHFKQL